jgi:hypothetical protein
VLEDQGVMRLLIDVDPRIEAGWRKAQQTARAERRSSRYRGDLSRSRRNRISEWRGTEGDFVASEPVRRRSGFAHSTGVQFRPVHFRPGSCKVHGRKKPAHSPHVCKADVSQAKTHVPAG